MKIDVSPLLLGLVIGPVPGHRAGGLRQRRREAQARATPGPDRPAQTASSPKASAPACRSGRPVEQALRRLARRRRHLARQRQDRHRLDPASPASPGRWRWACTSTGAAACGSPARRTQTIRVYNAKTGALLRTYTFPTAGFLNDLVITRKGVYATDSFTQQLAVVPFGKWSTALAPAWGKLPATTKAKVLPLTGADITYGSRLQRQRHRRQVRLADHGQDEHRPAVPHRSADRRVEADRHPRLQRRQR